MSRILDDVLQYISFHPALLLYLMNQQATAERREMQVFPTTNLKRAEGPTRNADAESATVQSNKIIRFKDSSGLMLLAQVAEAVERAGASHATEKTVPEVITISPTPSEISSSVSSHQTLVIKPAAPISQAELHQLQVALKFFKKCSRMGLPRPDAVAILNHLREMQCDWDYRKSGARICDKHAEQFFHKMIKYARKTACPY